MAAIKGLGDIAKKYGTVTPGRSADYTEGVKNPKRSWAAGAKAAEEAYKTGVMKAANAGRFGKGVTKAGDGKWSKGVVEKGTTRWGQGVQLGQGAYEQGFAPYHQAISSVTLSPRFARRDPRNLQRVADVVNAVGKVKEAQAS